MARRSTRIAILLASVLFATAAGAQAQDRAPSQPAEPLVFGTTSTYEVRFVDDPLAALANGTIIPRITVRGGQPFAMLMPPRTQFVVEMLKSVDKI